MRIKIKYCKLGKTKSWGWAHHENNLIELDTRLKGKKHLEILHHELCHLLFPKLSEEEIIKKSVVFTNILWEQGYRRIDNDNNTPLQDGTL
jgi:hypothetical protein